MNVINQNVKKVLEGVDVRVCLLEQNVMWGLLDKTISSKEYLKWAEIVDETRYLYRNNKKSGKITGEAYFPGKHYFSSNGKLSEEQITQSGFDSESKFEGKILKIEYVQSPTIAIHYLMQSTPVELQRGLMEYFQANGVVAIEEYYQTEGFRWTDPLHHFVLLDYDEWDRELSKKGV